MGSMLATRISLFQNRLIRRHRIMTDPVVVSPPVMIPDMYLRIFHRSESIITI